jgi:3-dehydroquinate synthase
MLHARHIAEGGDPFEAGSSRPLDFGHWAAHKLEQLSGFRVAHGDAVAVGVALDTCYAVQSGLLEEAAAARVLGVIAGLGLPMWQERLEERDASGGLRILEGLKDFREHLGGRLTVLMPTGIGQAIDVHELDPALIGRCVLLLKGRSGSPGSGIVPGCAQALPGFAAPAVTGERAERLFPSGDQQ